MNLRVDIYIHNEPDPRIDEVLTIVRHLEADPAKLAALAERLKKSSDALKNATEIATEPESPNEPMKGV